MIIKQFNLRLRINFNVTMLDLQCDYAAVDVVDVLGTNSMNVTKNVEKWQLDEMGKRTVSYTHLTLPTILLV